jgi:predicted amidohydrolase
MKIGVYQFAPEFGEKEKNLKRIEDATLQTDADLVVLPELCCTGYQFVSQEEVESLCEPIPQGSIVQRFIDIARRRNLHIVAGLGEKAGGVFYNSAVLVGPQGFIGKYRKVHLFWDEYDWFQSGNMGYRVWDIGPAKIGLMICYDWIYPEAARSLALQGADIICMPTNLVLPYCQDAMITRSIENRVFTVTANRTGSEKRGSKNKLTFTGGSQIVDPQGVILFRLGKETESIQEVEIDPNRARDKQITPRNHLWKDLRPDQYFNKSPEDVTTE